MTDLTSQTDHDDDQASSIAVVKVLLPSPLRRSFDYLPCDGQTTESYQAGQRVEAPFGRRKLIGMVISTSQNTELKPEALKQLSPPLDQAPFVDQQTLDLLLWVAGYYQHSQGDAIFSLLPAYFGKQKEANPYRETIWQISTHGLGLPENALQRAPKQQRLLQLLRGREQSQQALKEQGFSTAIIRELLNKSLIQRTERTCTPPNNQFLIQGRATNPALTLNPEQIQALNTTLEALNEFDVNLLDGITGSGKTEVYLQAAQQVLDQNKQVLVLVPEIALTPQTLNRFAERFDCKIAVYHSGLNDKERAAAWLAMQSGDAGIMLGTRSAAATPMAKPGLIIIDEEHDNSYKQQEGLRYSARDLAIARAQRLNIPVILGSATPSMESLHNANAGKYTLSKLRERNGGGTPAEIMLLDTRKQALTGGLSDSAIEALSKTLQNNKQALVFLNRRGYAPQLICHDCGWHYECPSCDAKLTYHKKAHQLRCHHCGFSCKPVDSCQRCGSKQIQTIGEGTEQCEETLQRLFSGTALIRIDRDSVSTQTRLNEALESIHNNPSAIIIGTQMLAKGHHFSNLETVIMLDIDNGLYSPDFRGIEKTLQLLTQVAGRAGRESSSGKVYVQTHLPDHPMLTAWQQEGYHAAATHILTERQIRSLPPFGFLASIGADSKQPNQAQFFLKQAGQQLRRTALQLELKELEVIGPFPALMERRAGRHRAHLLLKANTRRALQLCLRRGIPLIEQLPKKSDLRWQVDVDPQSTL